MNDIKGILVSSIVPMEQHIANGGEKLLGNASSIKVRPDGKVYISGQMQRHALFSSIENLNEDDPNKGDTYVANGDGISNAIEKDLRADMGGFMHPQAESYSSRRTAPLSATPAIALEQSDLGRDLLIRLRQNENEETRDQALATNEFSSKDDMHMNFFLEVPTLSISKKFTYEGEFHVNTQYIKHVEEEERKRRAKLFVKATQSLTDYANQARNAVAGEPQKVLIAFDPKLGRKAMRYFAPDCTEKEHENIIKELKKREAKVIIGDDTGEKSVAEAYEEALNFLNDSSLYDPSNGEIKAFREAFPE